MRKGQTGRCFSKLFYKEIVFLKGLFGTLSHVFHVLGCIHGLLFSSLFSYRQHFGRLVCIYFFFKLMLCAKRGTLDSSMKQSERTVLPCTFFYRKLLLRCPRLQWLKHRLSSTPKLLCLILELCCQQGFV